MPQPSVFFSYRTSDAPKVAELKKQLNALLPDLGYEDLSEKVDFSPTWKEHAGPLIDQCDALICVVGETTHSSEPINWELSRAIDAKRPIFVARIKDDCSVPDVILESGISSNSWDVKALAGALSTILIQRALFNDKSDIASILSQYGIMVQSWESLINRRQSVNQVYLSAVAALIAAVGGLIGFSKDLQPKNIAGALLIIGILGILLSWNWLRIISSYGTLSQAKSKVISAMEQILPARLFDVEWKVLQHRMYKSTTETDKRTISVVILLFALVSFFSVAYLFDLVF